jgi:GAF domain-containing protein
MDQSSGRLRGSDPAILKEISERITTIIDVKSVFDAYVATIAEAMSAERAFLMLKRPPAKEMKVYGTYNIPPEIVSTTAEVSQTVIYKVIDEKKAILSVDAMKDPRFQDTTSVVISGLRSILCVPIVSRGSVLGIIYLDNRVQNAAFKSAHQEVLVHFIEATGSILETLYRRVNEVEKSGRRREPQES